VAVGGTGTGGGTTGTYTAPKGGYGSSTGIIVGAAAAAGVGVTYLALRHHGNIVGCVEPSSSDGIKLMNEKEQNTYALLATNVSLAPGQRVALSGRKTKDDSGKPTFTVSKLVKDYGACK
jgi:hypothetical protein